ncbi:MAG: ATP-binding protein [Nanoarchaeota archaeon]
MKLKEVQMENIQDLQRKITKKEHGNWISAQELLKEPTMTQLEELCPKHNIPLELVDLGYRKIKKCIACSKEIDEEIRQRELESLEYDKKFKLQQVNIPLRFKDKTFDNYIIQNDKQKKVVEEVQWFIANYNNSTGIILIGNTGTGKNHLAIAMIKGIIQRYNVFVKLTEALKVIRDIKSIWKNNEENEDMKIKEYSNVGLLVIDEIGVQYGSETERMYLTEIINDRYNWMRPTVLIANLTIKELQEILGERVIDRFREGGKVIVFDWESYRK